ncbi:PEP-CTERM system histidine kinase PrsK [Sphingomonas sp. S1-29]|uniref:XrtA/PEP-CTERM system histidine kinase PrsK n=1 Tax=Sphingomonas sp. S1-29 TaxID=2991074 RepID=UPI002240D6CB|nr:XrtA/PEP-CTERM system histidine kinase PrsK [Sphingomonas sp. S1-29]UZK69457.1 PEP-CTERM system histidine kinase PrsK [Sphingomonas sp. S1-29]
MIAFLVLWSHALAALAFAALALSTTRQPAGAGRILLAAAFAATGLWALAVAGIGGDAAVTQLINIARNLAWLVVVHWLYRRGHAAAAPAATVFHLTVAAVLAIGGLLTAMAAQGDSAALAAAMLEAGYILRLLGSIGALVMTRNAYAAFASGAPRALARVAAAMWLVEVNLLTFAWATDSWPPELVAARGIVLVGLAAVLAVALQRGGGRPVQLSRAAAMQSLSLLAILGYFALLAAVTGGLQMIGGGHARLWQTAFVCGSTAAALAVLSTGWLRAWTRVKLAKHLFRHRYDYRAEWLRFTDTLGKPEDIAPLDERMVKAIADLTDSPAGLLLVPDAGGLGIGATWNWDVGALPATATAPELVRHLEATGRIIELDEVRAGRSPAEDSDAMPQWLIDQPDAWVVVPLPHLTTLAGVIVLARPPIDRALDWEDFDLLKVVGRQVASYLAEARAQARLTEAERFEEFNRRFAFILHDIKNLVSQLSLVARNAERHADNPAFRADMVATLNESATRMNDLLARLSQSQPQRADPPRSVPVLALAQRVASARRLVRPVVVTGPRDVLALADPIRLEQILNHLVQNAIEASLPSEPVGIAISDHPDRVVIEVIDRGCGMSPAFVRDRLFKPFVSTKASGFGIGAFEARQHAVAMGGTLDVTSREGEGSCFRLTLPIATAGTLERAA